MLTKSKSVSINGTSQVDGQIIGYFSANISEDGNVSSSATIADRKLYEVNETSSTITPTVLLTGREAVI